MFRAVTLALILVLSGCASMPQWSEGPADCAYETGRYNDGFRKCLSEMLNEAQNP